MTKTEKSSEEGKKKKKPRPKSDIGKLRDKHLQEAKKALANYNSLQLPGRKKKLGNIKKSDAGRSSK